MVYHPWFMACVKNKKNYMLSVCNTTANKLLFSISFPCFYSLDISSEDIQRNVTQKTKLWKFYLNLNPKTQSKEQAETQSHDFPPGWRFLQTIRWRGRPFLRSKGVEVLCSVSRNEVCKMAWLKHMRWVILSG